MTVTGQQGQVRCLVVGYYQVDDPVPVYVSRGYIGRILPCRNTPKAGQAPKAIATKDDEIIICTVRYYEILVAIVVEVGERHGRLTFAHLETLWNKVDAANPDRVSLPSEEWQEGRQKESVHGEHPQAAMVILDRRYAANPLEFAGARLALLLAVSFAV